MDRNYLHEKLTRRVIGTFYDLYNELGHGFLEVVYQRALAVAFAERGVSFKAQAPIDVIYHGRKVGRYFADFLVEEVVIVEIKACRTIEPSHESQLLNYLRGTEAEVGLLFNFGEKPAIRRLILTNDRKAGH